MSDQKYNLASKISAELLGTFVLVFGGCGSAIFSASEIGVMGVSFAFGIAVLSMAYAVGHISGGHFNPAVTFGAACCGRFPWKMVPLYFCVQVIGASLAGAVMFGIANGRDDFDASESGFASNGYESRSPHGYNFGSVFFVEVVATYLFLLVILGSTDIRQRSHYAPVSIGLALTLIHLVTVPISNTSVNPARSVGVAWFAGQKAIDQVWLFIMAPMIGGGLAGLTYRPFFDSETIHDVKTFFRPEDVKRRRNSNVFATQQLKDYR